MGFLEYFIILSLSVFSIFLCIKIKNLQSRVETLEYRQKAHRSMIGNIKDFVGITKSAK